MTNIDEATLERDHAMFEKRGVALQDPEFKDYTVKSVREEDESSCDVDFEEGSCLFVRNDYGLRAPKAGDVLRLFGRGFGYVVRGIGLLERGKLVGIYRYQTASEEEAAHKKSVLDSDKKKQDEWTAKAEETAKRIAALPEPFRQRFEFFMRDPDWGWDFGFYELFCCEEAVKIASWFLKPESMEEFAAMTDHEAQRGIAVAIGLKWDNHSGNTFGTACALARCFIRHPELVPKMHGALCPLVGCEEYGCYSTLGPGRSSPGRESGAKET
jgi:hypothetical protein